MKLISSIVFLLIQTFSFAQMYDVAIIKNDKASVYSEPNSKSKIIYDLNNLQVFFIVENLDISPEWLEIEINPDLSYKSHNLINGFIHKSKIIELKNYFNNISDDFILNFDVIKAIDSKFTINPESVFGLESPIEDAYSIDKMKIFCNNNYIYIEEKYYDDLININFNTGSYSSINNESFRIYKKNKLIIIKQSCGDGAGSYDIIWLIKDCKIIQRLINQI